MTKTVHVDGRPVWAEISLKAILHNLDVIRGHIGPNRRILAVVKSNAYGLGAAPIAKALEKADVDWFGVTWANEGVELRHAGIKGRILVLTGFWPGEEKRLIEHGLTPTVTRIGDVAHLERAADAWRKRFAKGGSAKKRPGSQPLRFHLKINTGMNRLGIAPSEIEAFAAELAGCKHVELEGTFTHLASSEERRDLRASQYLVRHGAARGDPLRLLPVIRTVANAAGCPSPAAA
jgi:alanine racemase